VKGGYDQDNLGDHIGYSGGGRYFMAAAFGIQDFSLGPFIWQFIGIRAFSF
jgi:hypothetical protein